MAKCHCGRGWRVDEIVGGSVDGTTKPNAPNDTIFHTQTRAWKTVIRQLRASDWLFAIILPLSSFLTPKLLRRIRKNPGHVGTVDSRTSCQPPTKPSSSGQAGKVAKSQSGKVTSREVRRRVVKFSVVESEWRSSQEKLSTLNTSNEF